jgi:hypothetical protein
MFLKITISIKTLEPHFLALCRLLFHKGLSGSPKKPLARKERPRAIELQLSKKRYDYIAGRDAACEKM